MPEPEVSLSTTEVITLHNFDNGILEREFQAKMTQVIEAINDDSIDGVCEVTVKLKFKKAEHQGFVTSTSEVQCKIPSRKSGAILYNRNGCIMQDVTSRDAKQPGLFRRADIEPESAE